MSSIELIATKRRTTEEHDSRFYATVVLDDMSPRYRVGEKVIYNQSIPAMIGDDVLIILKDGTEGQGLIRRLIGFDGTSLRLLQYNPRLQSEMTISSVEAIHPCVGYEAFRVDFPQIYTVRGDCSCEADEAS